MGLGFGSMDISIHALLAESDLPSSHSFTARAGISIHALLAESDGPLTAACTAWCNFYPRSPCGERRRVHYGQRRHPDFYPRSPCGERPQAERRRDEAKADFYPRSPCGERPPRMISSIRSISISIHALLAESDALLCNNPGSCLISIHALLAESDS